MATNANFFDEDEGFLALGKSEKAKVRHSLSQDLSGEGVDAFCEKKRGKKPAGCAAINLHFPKYSVAWFA